MSAPTSRPAAPAPGATACVYGFGVSGRAAASLLRSRGVAVVAVDDAAESAADWDSDPGQAAAAGAGSSGAPPTTLSEARRAAAALGVELRGAPTSARGRLGAELGSAVDLVIVSPGVPEDRPLLQEARRRATPILAEVELAYRFLNCPVVAITGSNGKSTTTALTVAMLRAGGRESEACGNFGKPLSACVEGAADRVLVLELSSFQLEHCSSLRPVAAALLNVAADHLDRHGTLEQYAAAKRRIFAHQRTDDIAILNAEDALTADVPVPEGVRRRWFSSRAAAGVGVLVDGCFVDGASVVEVAPGEAPVVLFELADVPLEGRHNLENAMAAALLARACEVAPAAIRVGLRGFSALAHRNQTVATVRGVRYIDDSKGTNVAATLRSLEACEDGSVHAILGGRGKGACFDDLVPMLRRKALATYLIGESAAEIADAIADQVDTIVAGTLATAVARATANAKAGEVVLLSPACASFDQFENYADRGRVFRALVGRLEGPEVSGG